MTLSENSDFTKQQQNCLKEIVKESSYTQINFNFKLH